MFHKKLLVLGVALALGFVWLVHVASCAESINGRWQGKLANGSVMTEESLRGILKDHQIWLESLSREGKQAILADMDLRGLNLRRADLRRANLFRADLSHANLSEANLSGVNLHSANLSDANLSRANLRNARLQHARLRHVDLRHADLQDANLSVANLSNGDLSDAELFGVGLSGADLSNANLSGAYLRHVDLRNANVRQAKFEYAWLIDTKYEPKPGELPDVHSIARANRLYQMCYVGDSTALHQLMHAFRGNGYNRQARQVRFAIRHNKHEPGESNWHAEIFYWLLEWPTGWGESFSTPLVLLAISMIPFAYLYVIALGWSETKGIIVRHLDSREPRKLEKPLSILLYGMRCSIQMALRFTWKDPSKGTWMTHMQPTDLVFVPKGGWRVVVGLQNIIGSYFIALFLLTYFGGLFKD